MSKAPDVSGTSRKARYHLFFDVHYEGMWYHDSFDSVDEAHQAMLTDKTYADDAYIYSDETGDLVLVQSFMRKYIDRKPTWLRR